MSDYYEKLHNLCRSVAEDFTDEGDEGSRPIQVYFDGPIDSNFPWLYLKFLYEGPLRLSELKAIEKRFVQFAANEGGHLETLHMYARGQGFVVKMVYVDGKKKAPAEEQGPEEKPTWDSTAECSCVNGCKSYYCDKL